MELRGTTWSSADVDYGRLYNRRVLDQSEPAKMRRRYEMKPSFIGAIPIFLRRNLGFWPGRISHTNTPSQVVLKLYHGTAARWLPDVQDVRSTTKPCNEYVGVVTDTLCVMPYIGQASTRYIRAYIYTVVPGTYLYNYGKSRIQKHYCNYCSCRKGRQ